MSISDASQGGSGGFSFGIGGQRGSGSGTSKTTGSGSTTADITRFDEESKAELDRLTALLGDQVASPNMDFSKQSAIGDVAGIVSDLFRQFSETALPEIFSLQSQSGGYNSTSAQFLANDAFAETASRSAKVTVDAIGEYEKLSQGRQGMNLNALVSALQLQRDATEKQSTTEEFKSKTKSSNKSSGGGFSLGFG